MQTIGYYVHHQGRGHHARAAAIAAAAPGRYTIIGTGVEDGLPLAPDLPGPDTRLPPPPHALHYAPLHHAGIRSRMAALAAWIARTDPALIVVDVSVEIAMFARLMAVPTIYVRLNGRREDPAHLDAFRSAAALLAPFHAALEDDDTPAWVRDKTTYCPGITPPSPPATATSDILIVGGAGGAPLDGPAIAAAARAVPGRQWRVIGPRTAADDPPNLTSRGWVQDAAAEIGRAAIVIGAAGDGLVNAVIAAAKPFICIPQARPYDEQHAKAARLHALGAAIVLPTWPTAAAWPDLIDRALALDTARLAALHDPAGAARASAFIIATSE